MGYAKGKNSEFIQNWIRIFGNEETGICLFYKVTPHPIFIEK